MYRWIRDLHLYFGLFISPFVLLFALSVFYLNHAKLAPAGAPSETFRDLDIPDGLGPVKGRDGVDLARALLPQIGIEGEIGFLRYDAAHGRLHFPVAKAGVEATVEVDLAARSATVARRRMGLFESISYLHKMPGPHNAAIRGNWAGTRVWRLFADATIYLLLFLSLSGLYLWWAIRAERTIGLALLGAGAATLGGLMYAMVR